MTTIIKCYIIVKSIRTGLVPSPGKEVLIKAAMEEIIKGSRKALRPSLLILALLLFLAGCGQAKAPGVNPSPGREEKSVPEEGKYMSPRQQENMALEQKRPPLDLQVPPKLETATFALG